MERSRIHHTILSASRQEPEPPYTFQSSRVRRRQTEDGNRPPSPTGTSNRWTKRQIETRDLSESTRNELKSWVGISQGEETVLPPTLEVGPGAVARYESISDEGYFSKQNSGHTCLEPMLGHPLDDSTRQFTCDIDGRPFNRPSDLDRHRHDVHPHEYPPAWIFPCPVPGCTRERPFARKDKCIAHLRQCHPSNRLPIPRMANPDKDSTTSSYTGRTCTKSIQPRSQNHHESHSTASHLIEDIYRRSDPELDVRTPRPFNHPLTFNPHLLN